MIWRTTSMPSSPPQRAPKSSKSFTSRMRPGISAAGMYGGLLTIRSKDPRYSAKQSSKCPLPSRRDHSRRKATTRRTRTRTTRTTSLQWCGGGAARESRRGTRESNGSIRRGPAGARWQWPAPPPYHSAPAPPPHARLRISKRSRDGLQEREPDRARARANVQNAQRLHRSLPPSSCPLAAPASSGASRRARAPRAPRSRGAG